MRKILTFIISISFLILPAISFALELNYPTFGGIKIELGMDLNNLVAWFYYFMVGISGLATFFMLVWGGVQWLTSAGSPTKVGEAKDRIGSAFLGLLIVLGSWLILQVINPDLTILNLPALP